MEQLQLADGAAAAAASAHNVATIYVRGTEALCMIQAASWLAMMQQQHADDPLAGTVVGLKQASGQLELLLVRSCSPAVDSTGCVLLDSTQLYCSGARGNGTLRVTDVSDQLPPSEDATDDSNDCISLACWEAAALQLQQQVPCLLGTKQQVLLTMVQLQQYNVAYQLLSQLQQQLAVHGFSMSELAPLLQQLPPTAPGSKSLAAVPRRSLFAVRGECVAAAQDERSSHAAASLLPHMPQQLAASLVQGLVAAQQQLEQIAQAQEEELPGWLSHLEGLQEPHPAVAQQQQQQQHMAQLTQQQQRLVQLLDQHQQVVQQPEHVRAEPDSVPVGQQAPQQQQQQGPAEAAVACRKRQLLDTCSAASAAAASGDDAFPELRADKRHKDSPQLARQQAAEVAAGMPPELHAAVASAEDEAACAAAPGQDWSADGAGAVAATLYGTEPGALATSMELEQHSGASAADFQLVAPPAAAAADFQLVAPPAAAAAAEAQDEAAGLALTSLEELLPPLPASPSAAVAAAPAHLASVPAATAAGQRAGQAKEAVAVLPVPGGLPDHVVVVGTAASTVDKGATFVHHAEEQGAMPPAPAARPEDAAAAAKAAAAADEAILEGALPPLPADELPPHPPAAESPVPAPPDEAPPAAAGEALPDDYAWLGSYLQWQQQHQEQQHAGLQQQQQQQQQQGVIANQAGGARGSSLALGQSPSWAGAGAQIAATAAGSMSGAWARVVEEAAAAIAAAEVGVPAATADAVRLGTAQQQEVANFEQADRLNAMQEQQQQQQLERSSSDMSLSEDLGLPVAVLQPAAQYQRRQQLPPPQQQEMLFSSCLNTRLAEEVRQTSAAVEQAGLKQQHQEQQHQEQQEVVNIHLDTSLSEGLGLPAFVLQSGAQHFQQQQVHQQAQQQHSSGVARGSAGAPSNNSASGKTMSEQPSSTSQALPAVQQQHTEGVSASALPIMSAPATGNFTPTATQQEIALAAEAAAALIKLQHISNPKGFAPGGSSAVSLTTFLSFCAQQWVVLKGQQDLATRLGGAAAAAAAFLQRWPHVFVLHSASSDSKTSGHVQLQKGAVTWLLTAKASQPILQAYREGLVSFARQADAAAPAGERRGVDVSHAADLNLGVYMTPLALSFRQLFVPFRQFLAAVGVLNELEMRMVSWGKQQLVPKQPAQQQQQQFEAPHGQQQQQTEGRPHYQQATRAHAACGAEGHALTQPLPALQRQLPDYGQELQQQQQQHTRDEEVEEEGEWHAESEALLDCHGGADLPITSILDGQGPSAAAAAAAAATAWVVGEPRSDVGSCPMSMAESSAADAMHAAAGGSAAAAAYTGLDGDEEDDRQMLLVIEAVSVLQKQDAAKYAVPLRAVMDSRAGSDADDRKLFQRIGGTKAAAVAWLQRWPRVFSVQQMALNPPGPGGVTSCFMVQLQQAAVQWLLSTQQFRRQLAGFRASLLAAVEEATAAAGPGERRGVEIGQVGNCSGYMPPALMPYRQLFASLRSFLAAAGLLNEFEVISVGGNRSELVLEQQHARGLQAHAARPQQQQQQLQLWQQWEGPTLDSRHQLEDQQWREQQQQMNEEDSWWQQGQAASTAAAAAVCDGCIDDESVDDDEEMPLVLEAVHALQVLRAFKHAVPMRAVMESTAAADGDARSLFARLGGSGAAAAAFLQRWPYVFSVHQVALDHPGPGGVRSGFQVLLQEGAVQWLLSTQQFRRQLAGFRVALLAAAQEATAAAGPGERRGAEIGKVGNRAPFGYITPGLVPYRQLFGTLPEFLTAAGLLAEFEIVCTVGTRRELVLKQQQQRQQELDAPLPSMQCNIAQQAGVWLDADGIEPYAAAAALPPAAEADDTHALLLVETAAALRRACLDSGSSMVQLRTWMESVGNSGIAARLGGSIAAAANVMRCRPDVFVVQQETSADAAVAGKHMQRRASVVSAGLQGGAVDVLMQTQHFNWLLQEYRQVLLEAVGNAAGAGSVSNLQGSAGGVELGKVGLAMSKRGLIPDELLPYKQLFNSLPEFLDAALLLEEFCILKTVGGGKTVLCMKSQPSTDLAARPHHQQQKRPALGHGDGGRDVKRLHLQQRQDQHSSQQSPRSHSSSREQHGGRVSVLQRLGQQQQQQQESSQLHSPQWPHSSHVWERLGSAELSPFNACKVGWHPPPPPPPVRQQQQGYDEQYAAHMQQQQRQQQRRLREASL